MPQKKASTKLTPIHNISANKNAPYDGSILFRVQVRKTYTGKLYGRQDDLIIALQLALIGCSKFWQDPKYRGFRANDYLTPQGLAEGPRM